MTADELEDVRFFVENMSAELKEMIREGGLDGVGEAAIEAAMDDAPLDGPRGHVFAMGYFAGAAWGRRIATRPCAR